VDTAASVDTGEPAASFLPTPRLRSAVSDEERTYVQTPVLGIVGAGQLARMTYQAVVGLNVPVRILAEGATDSAATIARDVTVGSWNVRDDLERFARGCDVITFDHELVDPDLLRALEADGHVLRPAPSAALFAQDKLHQRRELGARGLPVPAFAAVATGEDLVAFGAEHGWPVVAKACRGGYDGRGVWVLDDATAAESLWRDTRYTDGGGVELLVEQHVPIQREIAVAVVRRPSGEQRIYPVTETVQADGICVELVTPAPVPSPVRDDAAAIAGRIAEAIDAVGVMAVELFVTGTGLVLNELALRPHNSMHWTIEGARTSQFQNHARAVLDWPLGDASLTAPCVATVNVLGPADGSDPRDRVPAALAVPGVHVHLYDKSARPGRKLGHVTAVGDDLDETRGRARDAAARLTRQEDT
jgi:5-(carboxyamino)imidazole ribonucleotide synthase